MTDAYLLDSVRGLHYLSDAEMVRLAQLLLDQAGTSFSTQREIAKLLDVPMLVVKP